MAILEIGCSYWNQGALVEILNLVDKFSSPDELLYCQTGMNCLKRMWMRCNSVTEAACADTGVDTTVLARFCTAVIRGADRMET